MTTPPLRILIVDDDTERSAGWESDIKERGLVDADASLSALSRVDSQNLIVAVDGRRRAARLGEDLFSIPCALDDVDVLIVDYDLEELVDEGTTSTGLLVSMLARAFSRTKLIVLVNQFGSNKFDLTMTGSVGSSADFDVNEAQLLNPTLWDRTRIAGFAPWAWEDGILAATRRFEATVDWVRPRLNERVLTALGFHSAPDDDSQTTFIAKELWQECVEEPSRTFREMVGDAQFLTPKDVEAIQRVDESCARVAASIVMHWLDRWVIPGNETLIDLPHLASACPWLLIDRMTPGGWQVSAGASGFDAMVPNVRNHAFAPGFPLSRPVVWRRCVASDAELTEPAGFTYDDFPDMVFCENTSRFEPFDQTKSFSSRIPVGNPQRFVADPEKAGASSSGFHVSDVVHQPSVLFSL